MDLRRFYMKHRTAILSATVALAIISVSGCFSQKTGNSSSSQGTGSGHAVNTSWSGVRKVDVQDPVYGMTAYTINVPTGWKFAGKLLRPGGCHGTNFCTVGSSGGEAISSGSSSSALYR